MSLQGITDAANDLAALLEASAPKGLRHPRHSKHVAPARKRIKAVIAQYFGRQRAAVLAAVKPHIERELLLHPTVRESQIVRESAQGKTFARTLLPSSLHPLQFSATAGETSEYNEAITELIAAAVKTLEPLYTSEDLASNYLRENSLSRLTGGLDATTTERLQEALANAWDAGGSYDQMVAAIQDFDGFSEKRAGLVAQTEANDAYSDARQSTAEALGYDEKRWDPDGNACPECQANADQDWIDIGDTFESGDDAPTAHPACDCGCDYRKSSGDDE